jgi:N-glycosylase/DNA lyase
LDVTLCCGQVFRWDKVGDWWYGVANDKVFKARQCGNKLEYVNVKREFIEHYFGLDEDLKKIRDTINKDPHISKALDAFWGLRLIRQDPWECLVSYICATYKGIPAIKNMLQKISRMFGEKVVFEGCEFYTFPQTQKLANATLKNIEQCGLGYRAKYLLETSKLIFENNVELERLKQLPYEQAKKELCNFPGVGPKVADCVLLFSLGKHEAFPVDVWMKRVILNHYKQKLPSVLAHKLSSQAGLSNSEYAKLNEFGRNYFGEDAGYAQEYLYHYERMLR